MEDVRVNHIIQEKKKELDYLFVLPHAGIEYKDAPIPELITKYRDFIEWGADAVIASHPHCPQGWEEYKGKPIFYSLGNFFFNSKNTVDFVAKRPHWYEGLCVLVEIEDVLSYKIINVKNVANKQIIIDNSKERQQHNDYICMLLKDKLLYEEYLKSMLCEIESKLFLNIFLGLMPKEKKRKMKILLKYLYLMLRGQNFNQQREELKISLNNIAKRELIKRLLNL